MSKIAIACDHAGFKTKNTLIEHLKYMGYEVKDFGTNSEQSVDYPDFIHPLAKELEMNHFPIAIIICGSGNGVSMTANKHQAVRAALCWNTELAALARAHNDANICALPARFISEKEAIEIVTTFLNTDFEGGRHQRRVEKIPV